MLRINNFARNSSLCNSSAKPENWRLKITLDTLNRSRLVVKSVSHSEADRWEQRSLAQHKGLLEEIPKIEMSLEEGNVDELRSNLEIKDLSAD